MCSRNCLAAVTVLTSRASYTSCLFSTVGGKGTDVTKHGGAGTVYHAGQSIELFDGRQVKLR